MNNSIYSGSYAVLRGRFDVREPEEILAEIAALDAESAEILEGIRGML